MSKVTIKGCRTIGQYKILRWVHENFVAGVVEFTDRNQAVLTDIAGAKARLIYCTDKQTVVLEEY